MTAPQEEGPMIPWPTNGANGINDFIMSWGTEFSCLDAMEVPPMGPSEVPHALAMAICSLEKHGRLGSNSIIFGPFFSRNTVVWKAVCLILFDGQLVKKKVFDGNLSFLDKPKSHSAVGIIYMLYIPIWILYPSIHPHFSYLFWLDILQAGSTAAADRRSPGRVARHRGQPNHSPARALGARSFRFRSHGGFPKSWVISLKIHNKIDDLELPEF